MRRIITTSRGTCYVRSTGIWKSKHNKEYCPLCGQLVDNELSYLLITNGLLFPNCIIHVTCAPYPTEETVNQIHDHYLEYKKFANKYRTWTQ